MAKKNSNTRALLLSVLSLLLCVSMLVGTTFAWFTDEVTSGNNIIQSGNLDMVLSYKPYGTENTTWTEVTANTVIFDEDALYEPGYTEAVWFKIENAGSLAFRYQMALNVITEVAGKTKDGADIYLSDHLTVSATPSTDYKGFEAFFDRDNLASSALTEVGSLKDQSIALANNNVVFPEGDEYYTGPVYLLVVIQMPTTVGNEANHNGTDIPEITFGINALATQVPHEEDSFGIDYDAKAEYPKGEDLITDAAALIAALKAGESVKMGADITIPDELLGNRGPIMLENVGEVTLDLNGYTLDAVDTRYNNAAIYVAGATKLTITGDGEIVYGSALLFAADNAEVVIEGGTFTAAEVMDCESANSAIVCPTGSKNAKIKINGGTFDIAVKHYNNDNCDWNGELTYNVKDTNTLTINGGKFIEIAPPTQYLAAGATVTSEVVDGVTIYTVS